MNSINNLNVIDIAGRNASTSAHGSSNSARCANNGVGMEIKRVWNLRLQNHA